MKPPQWDDRSTQIGVAIVTGPIWFVSALNAWVFPACWCGVAFGLSLYQLMYRR